MTREDEIRARWSKVTPGVWKENKCNVIAGEHSENVLFYTYLSHQDDAIAVANAPADIDYLLQENQRLRDEFKSYRETTEEISQCYNDCHQDSWKFEEALRRIANKSLDDVQNVGAPNADEQQTIALGTLETVWKRREERANQALQPKEAPDGGNPD